MNRVLIFDTTLRDGEQAPGFAMTAAEKIEMAEELDRLNVNIIEVGLPACAPSEREAARLIAPRIRNAQVAVMARACPADIDCCIDTVRAAERPRIHVFIATSDLHIEQKLRSNRAAVRQRAINAVRYARNICDDVQFGCEDASRADREYLFPLAEAVIAAGARTVTIADTVGAATPDEYGDLIRTLRESVPNSDLARISAHCHDDLGLAAANSLAAVRAGASQIECTVAGIGERAGNAALEEVVIALAARPDAFDAETAVRTSRILTSARVLERITGVEVPPNKAVIGANAFRHGAGIHQHGIIVNERLYQFLSPAELGFEASSLTFGKYAGRHAIEHLLARLNVTLDRAQIGDVLAHVKSIAGKQWLTEDEVASVILAVAHGDRSVAQHKA